MNEQDQRLKNLVEMMVDQGVIQIVNEEEYEEERMVEKLLGTESTITTEPLAMEIASQVVDILKDLGKEATNNDKVAEAITRTVRSVKATHEINELIAQIKADATYKPDLMEVQSLMVDVMNGYSRESLLYGDNNYREFDKINAIEDNELLLKAIGIDKSKEGTEIVQKIRKLREKKDHELSTEFKINLNKDNADELAEEAAADIDVSSQLNGILNTITSNEFDKAGTYDTYGDDDVIISDIKQFFDKKFNMKNVSGEQLELKADSEGLSNDIVLEIRKLKGSNHDEYEKQLLRGRRVNKRDLFRNDGKIFMQKDKSEKDEIDPSIYLALDVSGSTSGQLIKDIKTVAASVIRALEQSQVQLTVIAYDHTQTVIKRGKERSNAANIVTHKDFNSQGGTSDIGMMKLMGKMIADDEEDNALIMIITDGDGHGTDSGMEFLKGISEQTGKTISVKSIGLSYNGAGYTEERAKQIFGAKNVRNITNRAHLAPTIAGFIYSSILKGETDEW